MQHFSSIILFYRPFFIKSFAVNFLLLLFGIHIVPLFVFKLFLVCFLWYITTETNAKRKLVFYKNLGISTFKLFSIFFVIDTILSIPFLLILKEFV